MSDPLATYLRGKLGHEQLVAHTALEQDSAWWWDDPDCDSPAEQHITMWRPEHALRVVACQLAILDRHHPTDAGTCGYCGAHSQPPIQWPCVDVWSIALVYLELPDFDPAWLVL